MEHRSSVTSHPPVRLESAIGLVVPPVAREHVLGDLAERYSSSGQYVLDALRTVPSVVVSQIRRTSYFLLWPLIGLGMVIAFGHGSADWWPRAVLPAVTTLFAFMIRDAYRLPDLEHPRRKGLVDIAVVAAIVVASQSLVGWWQPAWRLTTEGWRGGAIALVILYVLRLQNPNGRVPRFS